MKSSLSLWQFAGFVFTCLFGTLFHFLYEWTKSVAFAPFCAVNESTWEHMKIIFFPMLIFAVIEYFIWGKTEPCFWWIKCIGIVSGTLLVPILFYTYNGAFGKSPDFVNVLIFFISAGLAYWIETWLFKADVLLYKASFIAVIILSILGVAFVYFTFAPLTLPLFQDPVTLRYGLN